MDKDLKLITLKYYKTVRQQLDKNIAEALHEENL